MPEKRTQICDLCQKHVENLKSFQEGKSPEEIKQVVAEEFYEEVGGKDCFENLICLPMVRLHGP